MITDEELLKWGAEWGGVEGSEAEVFQAVRNRHLMELWGHCNTPLELLRTLHEQITGGT